MAIEQKITFAQYFLDKIKNAQTREDFLPNLSAFLSETRSIADYMLEDANVRFGLGITLEEKLYLDSFIETAKKQKNANALKFSLSYKSEFAKIGQNPIGKLLLKKRNIKVHRTEEPIRANFARSITESVHIHDSIAIEVRDKYGNLRMRSDSGNDYGSVEPNAHPVMQEKEPTVKSTDSVKWFFTDYNTTDVVEVCEEFLKIMKTFVSILETELP